jgi:hypothetical protein
MQHSAAHNASKLADAETALRIDAFAPGWKDTENQLPGSSPHVNTYIIKYRACIVGQRGLPLE